MHLTKEHSHSRIECCIAFVDMFTTNYKPLSMLRYTLSIFGFCLIILFGCNHSPKATVTPFQVDLTEYHEKDCSLADAFRASGEEPLILEDTMCSELTLLFPTVKSSNQAVADAINADLLKVYCAADETNMDCKSIDDVLKSFHQAASEMGLMVEIKSRVVVNDGEFLCIGHDVSTYGFGAAHPITGFGTSNYNATTGQIIHLADVFNEDGMKLLVEEGKKLHEEQLHRADVSSDDPSEVINWEFKLPEDFSIDKENIILYFDMYEVGPASLGNMEIKIPRSKLAEHFKN